MQSWRDVSPIMWKGHCPDCNEPTAHYRKLDHEWVYYNQCWVCGAVFNLRTESINPLEEAVKRFNRIRRLTKSFIIGFGNRKIDNKTEDQE